ncbi:hypothetical protein GLOTRDRAFT_139571 [Gloeophyllum trabeum ATCC 11539]|uniref:Uncharacterized protein n=1 Tax=Gloeophyllum trabeum (strain ATCC 11539 / FP-39264 / Madison 617) TaxID=670483 RepID=S7RIR5_GLOTA|nr:uncharacterized protein GLOTRDRAFT_139571 [Gloeophyllum trabeum ATCC 11539]EPQ54235.1 hypothetical protein GLOTRDRAFT_139571 [Gloeophyllum trabeum ATCC 11539]
MSSAVANASPVPVKHSSPIPIDPAHHHRRRSPSQTPSDASDASASPSSPFPLRTPPTLPLPLNNPRVAANSGAAAVSPSSPILSYFLSQSPTKNPAAATFPFRARGFGSAVTDDDDEAFASRDRDATPTPTHARRASTAYAGGRFSQQSSSFVAPSPQAAPDSRGAGLLRRLSLSGAFARPPIPGPTSPSANVHVPPPTPMSPSAAPPSSFAAEPVSNMSSVPNPPASSSPRRKPRSATVNTGSIRRAPSPMGERILKGHFDGFN